MFKPPKMDDDDFSPFGGKSGLFSGGRGLFDDDDEVHHYFIAPFTQRNLRQTEFDLCCFMMCRQGDLFSDAPKPPASEERKPVNDSITSTPQTEGKAYVCRCFEKNRQEN